MHGAFAEPFPNVIIALVSKRPEVPPDLDVKLTSRGEWLRIKTEGSVGARRGLGSLGTGIFGGHTSCLSLSLSLKRFSDDHL